MDRLSDRQAFLAWLTSRGAQHEIHDEIVAVDLADDGPPAWVRWPAGADHVQISRPVPVDVLPEQRVALALVLTELNRSDVEPGWVTNLATGRVFHQTTLHTAPDGSLSAALLARIFVAIRVVTGRGRAQIRRALASSLPWFADRPVGDLFEVHPRAWPDLLRRMRGPAPTDPELVGGSVLASADLARRAAIASRPGHPVQLWLDGAVDTAFLQAVLATRPEHPWVETRTRRGEHAQALRDNGFVAIGDLITLVSDPVPGPLPQGVRTGHGVDLAAVAEDVVERAEASSADWPELAGGRSSAGYVSDFADGGDLEPALTLLWGDPPAGIAVIAEEGDTASLRYVGVAPEARRRHGATDLVRGVLAVTAQRGSQRIVVACDARNTAAVRVYEGLGFTGVDRELVWIRRPREAAE